MGRSYWFECSKCGFRAKVSGRADRGLNCFVQTIVCHDCRELYDAVTRVRAPGASEDKTRLNGPLLRRPQAPARPSPADTPPSFQSVLNHLAYVAMRRFQWRDFSLRCPLSSLHRVQPWNDPDKCPRCGAYLEKSAVPYRIWT